MKKRKILIGRKVQSYLNSPDCLIFQIGPPPVRVLEDQVYSEITGQKLSVTQILLGFA